MSDDFKLADSSNFPSYVKVVFEPGKLVLILSSEFLYIPGGSGLRFSIPIVRADGSAIPLISLNDEIKRGLVVLALEVERLRDRISEAEVIP